MVRFDVQQTDEIIKLLQWHKSAGVDICLNETCRNQFLDNSEFSHAKKDNYSAQNATVSAPPSSRSPTASANQTMVSSQIPDVARSPSTLDSTGSDAPQIAQALAQSAKSLEELKMLMENFDACALKERATQLVFGSGNPKAEIMFIGKAPSNDDDMLGTPFAGKAGVILDAMLRSISLERSEVFLSNIVPWRPPGNRDPAPQEIEACLPFLNRQIELIEPKFIIAMGDVATKTLMGNELSVLKLDGELSDIKTGEHKSKIIASLHPQFLLQQPGQKRRAWRDLCNLQRALNN
ncbi:MAG: uracil-DNA glycosylase [Devosiaceae bacterium]|nr:uracil-DNA glycosylase [Devosiaceae bacterium]